MGRVAEYEVSTSKSFARIPDFPSPQKAFVRPILHSRLTRVQKLFTLLRHKLSCDCASYIKQNCVRRQEGYFYRSLERQNRLRAKLPVLAGSKFCNELPLASEKAFSQITQPRSPSFRRFLFIKIPTIRQKVSWNLPVFCSDHDMFIKYLKG